MGTRFLVRTCVDRLAEFGDTMVARIMKCAAAKETRKIEVRGQDGNQDTARLEIKYERIRVRPPVGKQETCPELELTVIHARETSKPRGRERIEWKLLTNLPVHSLAEALEKIRWYALRRKIEIFHKTLKSGCRAEQAKLRTTERLSKLIAVFCILSWQVFWLTMVQRTDAEIAATVAITAQEQMLLDKIFGSPEIPAGLSKYLIRIARLGGYLARASDPPPDNTVVWRGVSRLTDIHLGYLLAREDVGN